ncbi:MAG: hypothetical protein HOO19_16775 [Rhodospirillaceae bacterium]|jgi:hypothetical protein|nr:hypothetical protein [Rhodospirillaceae bacterium]MBT3887060.1 hypothetical protein [Rhodospirillaceae bacterium]MBT4116329.1 hypothetical protein [Rhodospirillaceae bacterium]MBT4670705.1 hypothetical protein [Rhodospirillaceae bacterium]MBT4719537.1 hypothetical protein [Rhodospirillaceae bacterium]
MTDPVFRRLNVMWELPDDWCEEQHIIDILASIEPRMLEMGLAERFVFVVTSVAGQLPMAHKERVIVLQTSDEGHEVPAYANDVFMTFKNYPPFGAVPDNLCAFPLGCNKDVAELPALGMAERPIDVFFIGRKEFRDEFFAATDHAFGDLRTDISKAPEFRKGLSPEDYADKLAQSKIALAPRGVSHETFRTYEALRAGCVVIAQRQIPCWWTNGWPVIEVDDWLGIDDVVRAQLDDGAAMQERAAAGRQWWLDKCSPAAVANYMMGEIAARLLETQR